MAFDDSWSDAMEATGGQPGVHDLMYGQGVEKSKLPAKFELIPVLLKFESEKQGRQIFKDIPHIHVYMPGGDEMVRRVEPSDRYKWPEAWEAFQKGQETATVGTPLEEWPIATPAIVAMLKAKNVFNVEGLGDLSDAHCEVIGAWSFDYRDKAQAWLESAAGNVVEEIKEENAALKSQLAEMQEAIKELQKPKRRGRRPGSKNKPKEVKNVAPDNDPVGNGPPVAPDA